MINLMIKKASILLIFIMPLIYTGCMMATTNNDTADLFEENITDPTKAIAITKDTFVCLKTMHPVRGFFVGNILGQLNKTIEAANSKTGATYPPGSIVQLIPTEVMIKHHQGWSPITNDWEFFELEVSEDGSKIKVRGTTQVINKFGGNCLSCHQKADPKWDLICEEGHGCDSLPIPDFVIRWTQNSDPRCE